MAQLFFGRNASQIRVWLDAPNRCVTAQLINASVGSNGPVLQTLLPVAGIPAGFALRFTADAPTESALNFGDLAVQCRDALNAPTMRAQLLPPGTTLLLAQVAGANVVPPQMSPASGRVIARLNFDRTRFICVSSVSMLTPTAATVNIAPAGMNGPMIAPLTLFGGQVSGSLMVTPAQVNDIIAGNS